MSESQLTALSERVDEIHGDVRRVLNHMEGPQGFHVRIDRIEQQAERSKWMTRTAVGAAFAACVGVVVKWFHTNPPTH
jgi:hypothetical protein